MKIPTSMCGEGVCSIFLLSPVAICLETIDVCIWRTFVRPRTFGCVVIGSVVLFI